MDNKIFLSKSQQEMLFIIKENDTYKKISKKLNLIPENLPQRIKKLVDYGYVRKEIENKKLKIKLTAKGNLYLKYR